MATLNNVYAPLKATQLKESTNKKIKAFWDAELNNLGIKYETTEPGILATVEHIGEDWLLNKFQPYAVDGDGVIDGYEVYTLGELSASRQVEHELIQFQVTASKVESFLNDTQIGLLKVQQLLSPIEILYIKDDAAIIGGGRHRTTGLLTLCRFIDGYKNLKVAVAPRHVANRDEAINYIFASNASRNMTPFEKEKLKGARKGLSIVRDGDELLEKVSNKSGLTDIGAIAGFYFAAEGRDAESLQGQTPDTLGKIGKSFLTNFTKLVKDVGGDAKALYLFKGTNGNLIASTIVKYAFKTLSESWDAYLDDIREPIKDRKTGEYKVDEKTGETVYSINVSRNTTHIAKTLAEGVFAVLEDDLKQIFQAVEQAEQQEKAAKEAAKEAKKAKQQVTKADNVLEYIQNAGIDLPPEVLRQIQEQKLKAEQEAAQAAATPVATEQVNNDLGNQLDALLS